MQSESRRGELFLSHVRPRHHICVFSFFQADEFSFSSPPFSLKSKICLSAVWQRMQMAAAFSLIAVLAAFSPALSHSLLLFLPLYISLLSCPQKLFPLFCPLSLTTKKAPAKMLISSFSRVDQGKRKRK